MERLQKEENVDVKWVYFPLHPETPVEGRALSDLFRGRETEIAAFQDRMKQMAAEQGLPWGSRTMTWNSRRAQELAAWADTQPGGQKLHKALYEAYFVDGANIYDRDLLLELVAASGLDTSEAVRVIDERLFARFIDADWFQAREQGVTGVPTFMCKDLYVVGCQPYETLIRFVNHLRTLTPPETGA
ncbi:MAG: DsbA family protein [Pseudomonadales bacterium]|nr:DsbA family protein [Pseudomonadales bacterium]